MFRYWCIEKCVRLCSERKEKRIVKEGVASSLWIGLRYGCKVGGFMGKRSLGRVRSLLNGKRWKKLEAGGSGWMCDDLVSNHETTRHASVVLVEARPSYPILLHQRQRVIILAVSALFLELCRCHDASKPTLWSFSFSLSLSPLTHLSTTRSPSLPLFSLPLFFSLTNHTLLFVTHNHSLSHSFCLSFSLSLKFIMLPEFISRPVNPVTDTDLF